MIPTFVQQIVGVFVRAAVVFLVGWVAAHGGPKFSDNQIARLTAEVGSLLSVLVWSIWQKYRGRQKLMVAQASSHPMSENHVEMLVASGQSPSVLTPSHEAPSLTVTVDKS